MYFVEPFELVMRRYRERQRNPYRNAAVQKLRMRLPKQDDRHVQYTDEYAEVEHEPLPV